MKKIFPFRNHRLLVMFFSFLSGLALLFLSCNKDSLNPENRDISQDRVSERDGINICVLSWNTHLLDIPDITEPFSNGGCDGYGCVTMALEIAARIKNFGTDYDIILLQEVWVEEARQALVDELAIQGYIYSSYELGAGLLTLSKYPITARIFVPFVHENGVLGCSSDEFACKGFLYNEIKLGDNCYFHVINTHLDAGDCEGDIEARKGQLQHIRNWIMAHLHIYPYEGIILGGDFNVKWGTAEYDEMTNNLQSTASFEIAGVTPQTTGGGGTSVLDYIFIYNGTHSGISNATHRTLFKSDHCYYALKEDFIDEYIASNGVNLNLFNTWDTFDEVPNDWRPYVKQVCVPVNASFTTQDCYYVFTSEYLADHFYIEDISNIVQESYGKWENYEDVPIESRPYVEQKCVTVVNTNPSDHNPIESCMDYECRDRVIVNPGGGDGPTDPNCGCPPELTCVDGHCLPNVNN